MFKDAALAMELSPRKKTGTSPSKSPGKSPGRDSMISSSSKFSVNAGSSTAGGLTSPSKISNKILDLHKKTGVELRESPSKAAKIILRYINNYADVGPIIN